jgi:outer membrane protein assembly factor BamE (lipoprotein component of BamABCDE complex)
MVSLNQIRSRLKVLGTAAALAIGVCAASPAALASRSDIYTQMHAQSIQAGMSGEKVISLLGRPTRTEMADVGGIRVEMWYYDKEKSGMRGAMTAARSLLRSAAELAPDKVPQLAEADKHVAQAQRTVSATDGVGKGGGLKRITIRMEDGVVAKVAAD